MLYLKNNDDYIESYYILFTNSNSTERFRLSNYAQKMNLKICKRILGLCDSGYSIQRESTIDLDFFENKEDKIIFDDIINSNLSKETKKYLLNTLESFKDFAFFIELMDGKIELKKYYDYKISELIIIKDLCEQNMIKNNASDIIKNIDMAEKNAKVLNLVNKINKM